MLCNDKGDDEKISCDDDNEGEKYKLDYQDDKMIIWSKK